MDWQKLKPHMRSLPEGMTLAHPVAWISTWFGVGLLRPAPGTLGTLAALPFGYAIMAAGGHLWLALAAVLLSVAGTIAGGIYGRRSGTTDDQSIVVDEAAGVWIAAIPAGENLWGWAAAFLLFRLFDIFKPWPASFFDKRGGGGFDVMMDDVVAGIYAMFGVSIIILPFYYV